MRFAQNIKLRLTLWYLLILTILIFFFSAVTYLMLALNIYHVSHRPHDVVTVFMAEIEGASNNTKGDVGSSLPKETGYRPLLTYNINMGQVAQIQSEARSLLQINVPEGKLSIDQKSFITTDMSGEQEVSLYYRPSASKPGYYEILAITKSRAEIKYTLVAFQQTLLFAIPTTLILAGLLSFLLTRKALQPVDAITKAAREIEEKDLSRRIKVRSKDELGQLAETLNQMLERLQRAFDRERRFTTDASHEMRTPLSVIQGEATLALSKERSKEEYQRSLELISQEASHMISVVSKLLGLAEVDAGRESLNFEEVSLKELLTELASDIRVLCEDKSICFQLQAPDAIIVKGDRVKLRQLFLNLLDNAIRHTPQGGSIFVSLNKQGDSAYVSVRDTGVGISEEHLPHIFERFYRVDKSRSRSEGGAGLGLSICQRIAELHGGKIEVESKVGEGSTFTVLLPTLAES